MNINEESRTRYFDELSLRLRAEGIQSKQSNVRTLRVYQDGQPVCDVAYSGDVYRDVKYPDIPGADELYQRTAEISGLVKEYMQAIENAPPVPAKGLNPADDFRLLADYGNCVLAGQQTRLGCQFVTWSWDPGHEYVVHGHYTSGDYRAAKQDFALRSGLIPNHKFFSDEQVIEIYRCCEDTLSAGFDLTHEQEKCIRSVQEQILNGIPDIIERINEQDQRAEGSQEQEQTM